MPGMDMQDFNISGEPGGSQASPPAHSLVPSKKLKSDSLSAPADGNGTGGAMTNCDYPPGKPVRKELTAEEEKALMEHLPIVRFLARRIHERLPQHVEIEDLFSAGLVGLMDAFAKFDPTKKVQFRSYAQFRIRGAILDSLRSLDWSPRELRRKGRAVEEAIRVLMSRLGHAPTETEIAVELGTTLEAYQLLLGDLKGLEIGTLHLERNEDSGEEELAYVPGRPEEDPLFKCLRGEMEERLTGAIQELPERERLVMTLYYYEEMTMREIGLALGVVESRVSQIHASAVLHLRSALSDLSTKTEGGMRMRKKESKVISRPASEERAMSRPGGSALKQAAVEKQAAVQKYAEVQKHAEVRKHAEVQKHAEVLASSDTAKDGLLPKTSNWFTGSES